MELLSQGVITGHPSCGQYEDEMSKRFLARKACERNSGGRGGGRTRLKSQQTAMKVSCGVKEKEKEGKGGGWWRQVGQPSLS